MEENAGQGDVLSYGSVVASGATDPGPSGSGQTGPSRLSMARTEPHRGILNPASPLTTDDDSIQVWSMDLIKTLDTNWFGRDGVKSVGEMLPVIIDKVTKWEEYDVLKKSMQVYGQQVPVRLFYPIPPLPGKLRDGINRVALAEIMGWDSMLVSQNIMEKSMWVEWDESEMGRSFHDAKAMRMGLR